MFHWWRAYHVRLTKLDCLPRISARGRQCIIHRWINKKKSRAPSRGHATFGQKINKIFHVFSLYFSFLWLLVYNKILILTETSGKQYVLWAHKTYGFPRSQSISVKCLTQVLIYTLVLCCIVSSFPRSFSLGSQWSQPGTSFWSVVLGDFGNVCHSIGNWV